MSIKLEATYCKKLGLPNFSSHSFMISVRAEVSSLRRLETESTRLYRVLQASVDKEIQQPGFLPDASRYGMIVDITPVENGVTANGKGANGASSDKGQAAASGTGSSACSEKQKALIERVAKEQKFTSDDLDGIADRLFKLPVQRLNKKQTSAFISELLAIAGPPRFRNSAKRPAATFESV